METIRCLCCGTPMRIVPPKLWKRKDALAPPSYECPKCFSTAQCDRKGQLSHYDPDGRLITPSYDRQ